MRIPPRGHFIQLTFHTASHFPSTDRLCNNYVRTPLTQALFRKILCKICICKVCSIWDALQCNLCNVDRPKWFPHWFRWHANTYRIGNKLLLHIFRIRSQSRWRRFYEYVRSKLAYFSYRPHRWVCFWCMACHIARFTYKHMWRSRWWTYIRVA